MRLNDRGASAEDNPHAENTLTLPLATAGLLSSSCLVNGG